VESIPFTETREYVEAILRNESIYRELNGVAPLENTLPQTKTLASRQ
jgi:soluble lytic murein transglycosylase